MADTPRGSAALIAACDRICGIDSRYHKDRCPLYRANCEAIGASMNLVTLSPALADTSEPVPVVVNGT